MKHDQRDRFGPGQEAPQRGRVAPERVVGAFAMREAAVGAAIAAPAPCTARAVISHAWSVANPPSSEASAKTRSPAMKPRRRSSRSPDG